jgi:DNA invertase Pin-like site-specific DNA recombinase
MTKRAALYCRISQKEEGVDKTANQEAALRQLGAANGYVVAGVFTDDDISAYRGKLDRPAWTRMLSGLKNKDFDVVMAVAPDRFTRGAAAELEALQMLCVEAGAVIHTKSAGVQDPATPMVRAMLQIQDIFGGLEVDVKRQKQADRNEAELSAGMPLWGTRPFGFAADPDSPMGRNGQRTQRWTVLEPTEAEAVRKAYDRILNGSTLYRIAVEWNEAGLKTTDAGRKTHRKDGRVFTSSGRWTTNTVRQVLTRPRNAGLLERKGSEPMKSDKLSQIVSEDQWRAMLALLAQPERKPKRGPQLRHLLSGLMSCQCGATMTAGTVHSRGYGLHDLPVP